MSTRTREEARLGWRGALARGARATWSDAWTILVGSLQLIWRNKIRSGLGLALIIGAVLLTLPHDRAIHEAVWEHRLENDDIFAFASAFRDWGKFYDTIVLTLLVFTLGCLTRRETWRCAALACFIGATLGGMSVNVVRLTAGRPRPRAGVEDGFYGPSLCTDDKRQSFPSGHSGTSTGNAVGLSTALWAMSPPAMLSAGCILWSCVYSGRHYLSDVLAGMGLGIFFGIPVGLTARRLARSRRRKRAYT